MMQVYVKESNKALELYQKAFDAELRASYPNDDGTFMHAEIDVYGQVLAISEARKDEERSTGTGKGSKLVMTASAAAKLKDWNEKNPDLKMTAREWLSM
jgi:uncharacterized glyoxalase superfamily protein PhnB